MKRFFLCIITLAIAPGAHAQERAVFGIVVENDIFAGSDRDYTNGIKLAYVSPEGRGAALARRFLFASDDDVVRLGFGAGQNIYTPDTYQSPVPPPGEHPYAGWLYAEGKLFVERGAGVFDILTLSLGVIGPASLAGPTQRTVHKITNDAPPLGWDAQLGNEPALLVSFDRSWRRDAAITENLDVAIAPFAGASAGNILTEARGGVQLRIGPGVARDLGPMRIGSSIPSVGVDKRDGFSWTIFAGAAGRAIARDIFLDGNSFADGPSVDKKTLVGEFQGGLSFTLAGARISYTHVWRTRRYDTEPSGHAFGAVSVSGLF